MRVLFIVALVFLSVAALCACGAFVSEDGSDFTDMITVYYVSEEETEVLTGIGCEVPEGDAAKAAVRLIDYMRWEPGEEGLKPVLSGAFEAVPAGFDSGTLSVTIKEDGEAEVPHAVSIGALVLTLCGLQGVERVELCYDSGFSEVLSAGDVILQKPSFKPVERELVLYFPSKAFQGYVEIETRNVVLREDEPLARFALEELLKGPRSGRLEALPPIRVVLSGVTGKTALLTISDMPYGDYGDEVLETAVAAIVNTLTSLDEIDNVLLSGDGQFEDEGVVLEFEAVKVY